MSKQDLKKKHYYGKMMNEQYISDHSLKECLYAFRGAGDGPINEKLSVLEKEFFLLAQKMLYGGFMQVGDDYEIYIRTVEFYYHEEEETENQIQDPIVYHRNGRFPGRVLPPFPMMTIHAHWSGYDITFEDSCERYRASALIREFAVFDRRAGQHGSWVYWFTGEEYGDGRYEQIGVPKFDDRSTYLQFYLNGFSIDGSVNRVVWRDFKSPLFGKPTARTRRNVFKDKEKTIPCDRLWAFRRDDSLNAIRKSADSSAK